MEHNDVFELIPAYALGVLDEAELHAVETHLAGCTACRAELAVYEDVADQLALAVPQVEPPAALHGRLMAWLERPTSAAAPPARPARAGFGARLGALFQALAPVWTPVSLVLILLLVASNLLLWQQVRQAEAPPPEPVSVYLGGTEAAPGAAGFIIFEPGSADALLVTYHLPTLEPDQQYQLWLIHDGSRDSGGVFSVSEHGNAVIRLTAGRPVMDYSAVGVTVEPAGGSPGPTGDRVLGGDL
ncbi:MAG TPA: anti-sigma factor [Aggregatilineales bacterium]|nr:anti-sigma factor [Aggregatilineales bacterium]